MKILLQKISLFVVLTTTAYCTSAQVIEISASVSGLSQTIANSSTFDATNVGSMTINLKDYLPVTVSIKNTSSTTNLILNKVGGKYIVISGMGASDFTIIEPSTLTGTIAPGATQTFTVNLSSSATNGSNKIVTLNIQNNSISNSTAGVYSGNIKYNLSGIVTATTKASDIGLSMYPNPSNDGYMHVSTNNVKVDRIVVSNIAGQTEEFNTIEFKTTFKGLLLVRLYTDKGVVSEKIIIQE